MLCAAGEIWGGVERFVCLMAEQLRRRGALAGVVLFHHGLLEQRLRQSGVPVNVMPRRRTYDPRAIGDLVRALRDWKADVLHVHGYRAAIVGGVAGRLAGCRIVKTEHGHVEPGAGIGHFKMRANALAECLLSPFAADAVAFVSNEVRRTAAWAFPLATRRVIPNGIPLAAADARPRGAPAGRFAIGIVGRVTEVKGHRVLLRAVALLRHLPGLHLFIVGDGPLIESCRADVVDHQLTDRVTFLGFRDDVPALMGGFDVLVMPSLDEGLPYTLLEAMSLRVPVVASAVGGLAETIEHGRDGYLVPPRDARALAGALEALYRDPALRRDFALHAFEKLQRSYSVSACVGRYLELYGGAYAA